MEKKVFWRGGWSEERKEEMKERKERKKDYIKREKKDNSGKGVYLGSVISSMLAYKSS